MDIKDKILLNAEKLFFRFGVRSISMDDIAKDLGVSKKTIYKYFKNKRELVNSLIRRKLEEDVDRCQADIDKSANIVEEMFHAMKHISEVIGNTNANLFYDLRKYYPKAWEIFHDFKSNYMRELVESALERGKKQGYVRKEIDSKILAIYRVQAMELGFDPEIYHPSKFNLLDVQMNLIENFLYGICTLKGHKLINKFKKIVEDE